MYKTRSKEWFCGSTSARRIPMWNRAVITIWVPGFRISWPRWISPLILWRTTIQRILAITVSGEQQCNPVTFRTFLPFFIPTSVTRTSGYIDSLILHCRCSVLIFCTLFLYTFNILQWEFQQFSIFWSELCNLYHTCDMTQTERRSL